MSVFNSRKHFQPFFDWVLQHIEFFERFALATYSERDGIPALRFFQELVLNKSSRFNFDINSASGIILFREISRVFCEISKKKYFYTSFTEAP